jgi:hypothetical protein
MTSLFNAWLDNQNLYQPDKRWVVAFAPRLAWEDGRESFFSTYPDGRLVSIIRDPYSWFTSARGRVKEEEIESEERMLSLWRKSAEEMLAAKSSKGDQVFIVGFDELINDTEATMRRLADYLGIDFEPVLTTPTFNLNPVGANSSYGAPGPGVHKDPLTRHEQLLSDEQRAAIDTECRKLYEQVLAVKD